MRYSVNGHTIRSENAAKPIGFASGAVLRWIEALPRYFVVLDYGCGKFRHTIPLARRVRLVVAVDSSEQIDRLQRIGGRNTTARNYGARLANVQVHTIKEQAWRRRRYDAAICTNVLSAIPTRRDRIEALYNAASVLKPRTGRLLVTTQYRNSHFAGYRGHPGARWFRDGWLVTSCGRTSFYAMLDLPDLASLCSAAGLQVVQAARVGESALVTCRLRYDAENVYRQ